MQKGRIVEFGETEQVLQRPAHEYTRTLLAAVPRTGPPAGRAPGRSQAGPHPLGGSTDVPVGRGAPFR
jgi:ABC-type dipeptide/oligopeptide/nickel transport system ATPase component